MRTTLFFAALIAASVSAPALAHEPDARATRIRVADLVLTTAPGKGEFEHRVRRALEYVCGTYSDPDMQAQDRVTACRTAARTSIDRQVAVLGNTQALAAR